MIAEEIWNEFIKQDAKNNINYIQYLFGTTILMDGFDVSSNIIHLDNISTDIFMKWYIVLDNAEYIKEDKIFDDEEIIELVKFYYNILNKDISLAFGNIHMLTGAINCIVQVDTLGNETLYNLCCENDIDSVYEPFFKIIINYNNRIIVLYISEGVDEYEYV